MCSEPPMKSGYFLRTRVGYSHLFSPVLLFAERIIPVRKVRLPPVLPGVWEYPEINVRMVRRVCFCPFPCVYEV